MTATTPRTALDSLDAPCGDHFNDRPMPEESQVGPPQMTPAEVVAAIAQEWGDDTLERELVAEVLGARGYDIEFGRAYAAVAEGCPAAAAHRMFEIIDQELVRYLRVIYTSTTSSSLLATVNAKLDLALIAMSIESAPMFSALSTICEVDRDSHPTSRIAHLAAMLASYGRKTPPAFFDLNARAIFREFAKLEAEQSGSSYIDACAEVSSWLMEAVR